MPRIAVAGEIYLRMLKLTHGCRADHVDGDEQRTEFNECFVLCNFDHPTMLQCSFYLYLFKFILSINMTADTVFCFTSISCRYD